MGCQTSLLLEVPKFDPWMMGRSGDVDDQLMADSFQFQTTEVFEF